MSVANCPKCREPVRLPAAADPASFVRCPWCREQYPLRECLAGLPPQLIVLAVSAGSPPGPEAAAGAEPIAWTPHDEVDAGAESASVPRVELGGVAGEATATRRKRGQRSPVREVLMVVLGGLLAVPLAQLILWWLPDPLQRDPFDLGPDVSRVVPWVVPPNLRADEPQPASQVAPASSTVHDEQSAGHRTAPFRQGAFSDPATDTADRHQGPAEPFAAAPEPGDSAQPADFDERAPGESPAGADGEPQPAGDDESLLRDTPESEPAGVEEQQAASEPVESPRTDDDAASASEGSGEPEQPASEAPSETEEPAQPADSAEPGAAGQ